MAHFMDEFERAVDEDPAKAASMVHELPEHWNALEEHEKAHARGYLQRLKDWLHEPPRHEHRAALSVIISSLD